MRLLKIGAIALVLFVLTGCSIEIAEIRSEGDIREEEIRAEGNVRAAEIRAEKDLEAVKLRFAHEVTIESMRRPTPGPTQTPYETIEVTPTPDYFDFDSKDWDDALYLIWLPCTEESKALPPPPWPEPDCPNGTVSITGSARVDWLGER